MSKIVQLEIPFDFEEFRDIENYEGLYKVTSYGRIYSVKSNKFLKPQKHTNNYLFVQLCKNGKGKFYLVHRLVAQAFIPNPLNLPEVNHKSEVKSDNRVENLEWMSHKENVNYGSRTERIMQHPNCVIKQPKVVLQFDKQGDFVAEYPSLQEAERATGIFHSNISKCCNGNYKSAGKYVWRFKDYS